MIRVFFLIFLMGLSGCHVGRFVIYNFADYKDYRKFPVHTVHADSSNTYTFPEIGDEQRTISAFPDEHDSFEDWIEKHGTLAFMVIRNDTIQYEWYKKDFDRTSIFTSFSLMKSIVSMLAGIAIEEGRLNLSDEIGEYLPEIKDTAVQKVQVDDLLNMTSGIKFKESYFNPFASIARLYYGRRILRYIRNLKLEHPPGGHFHYSSMDTQLLSLVIERATGTTISEYMEQRIWSQISTAYDATWNVDSKRHDTEKGFACFNATMVDYAKLGKLMLQNGKWNDEQIIPAGWIERSVRQNALTERYAYQWWFPTSTDDLDYVAQGILGQYLYINEESNTIVLRFGKKWGKINWTDLFYKLSSKPALFVTSGD